MRVVYLGPSDFSRWDQLVASHPAGSAYYHRLWLRVLERAFPCEAFCLGCEDTTGQLQGILPLCWTSGWLSGSWLCSLPHTPFAGALTTCVEAELALVRAAVDLVHERPGAWLQLRPPFQTNFPLPELVEHPAMCTHTLRLPSRPSELRFGSRRNHHCEKTAFRKAANLGVRVQRAETQQDLRRWYRLYLETMRAHAAAPLPYSFFVAVWELMVPAGLAWLLLAQKAAAGNHGVIAGTLYFGFGSTMLAVKTGRSFKWLALRPNEALHWSAIHEACESGFRYYDFGESPDENQGLARFKSKWGAEARRLYRYGSSTSRDVKRIAGSWRSGPIHRLAAGLWRAMPLTATQFAGAWIYRHV
jgi:hypothetical protein